MNYAMNLEVTKSIARKVIRKLCLSGAMMAGVAGLSLNAQTFNHPCIPNTLQELDTIKANLDKEPWKTGYELLAADGRAKLTYTMAGPFTHVSRAGAYDQYINAWAQDMTAVYCLARMWYFTGNAAYAQKARDILVAWATTHVSFTGNESGLALGDLSACFGGGASILRGTWSGWTASDTTAVQNYFANVLWPASAGWNTQGPANKGTLYLASGMSIALFCDNDPSKFDHVLNMVRTFHGTGLMNTLPTGQMGESGRDAGHAFGNLNSMAFIAECAWKQGVDLYSELDNRLLACGEYYARNTFTTDNPYIYFGTIDWQWISNKPGPYTANRSAFYILQNAYKNRKGLPTPWIDHKLQEQPVDGFNFMYAKTADFTTATATPASFPAVSLASNGLTLTTLGTQTVGRSVSYSNGVWTMTGLGNGVWSDTTDDCQFAYKQMTGDCAMVAKITSAQYPAAEARAGLMIRDNLAATIGQRAWIGAVSAPMMKMESHMRGWTVNWGGGGYDDRSHDWPPGLPYWIKIERRGKQITTFASPDGTSWSPLNCTYYGNLPSTLYIGLFVCSGTTTTNTATFENVAFTGGAGGLVTTPAAPVGVLASGSNKAITVHWLASFGATAYDVLRSTTSGSGYTVLAGDLAADKTSYVDTTAVAGTTYYYVVQAKNAVGTSGTSPEFGAALLGAPLANLAFSGTSTASFNQASATEGSAKAFDSNPGSKWFGYNSPTGWLQYDFGAGNAQIVKRYTISSADVAGRDPKDWQLQGSQDGANWTTLDTQSGQLFAYRMQQNTYDVGNTAAYRYYRLNVTANNGDTSVAVAELGLWGDSGRTLQDGRYRLVNRHSNKVAAVSGGATTNGTPLVQQAFNGSDKQQWDITWAGNGQYRATNVASATVMDNGGTSNAGENLIIQPSNGGNSQLWRIFPDSDGFFRITSENSGLVVDVSGGSIADGTNLIQASYNGSDSQQWSTGVASASQPIPPTPTGLAAAPASISQITLTWTASAGAISYNVKRATVSGGPYTTVAVSVNTTNFLDAGLFSATTYFYVVSAVSGSGESTKSVEASATTLAAPPAAPTGLSAILGHNQVTLSWNVSAAATSYNVKRATTSGGPYTTVASGVTSTNYTNTGLTNGVTYYYVVSASNGIGTGPDSAEVTATPSTLVVHLKFDETSGTLAADSSGRAFHASLVNGASFSVGAFGSALALTTNSPQYASLPSGVTSGITNFTVSTWVKVNAFANWQRIFDFGAGTGNYMFLTTQYTPTAPNNAKLRFGIRTTVAAEQSVSGNSIGLPTNAWAHVAVTRSGNMVSLYVNGALAGSGSITLNPSDLGVTTQNYLGKSQFNDPYLNGNLDDFRLYSHAMSVGDIAALANPAAGAPLQLAAVPGDTKVTLTWLPNATTTYTVKRSDTSGGPYATLAAGLTNLTYIDTGLTNGVTYYYVVSGANLGGSGPDSAEVTATPSDLGLHLKFDESEGSVAADSSFRAFNATLVNGPIFAAGKINNALTLVSSSSQHATLPTGVLNDMTNCTIMGWVKLNTVATWQRIFDFGTGTTNYMFLTTQFGTGGSANRLRFAIRTPGVAENAANRLDSSVTTPIGSWAHFAVVLSNSTGRLYLNGAQVAVSTTMTLNPSSLGVTAKNYLGKSQFNDPYFDGALDDFRIYSRALTVGEIAKFQTPLTAPTGLDATPGNAQVQLTWNSVANATSYTLSRSSNSSGPFAAVAQPVDTSFTDTNVVNGGTYYYVVRAANFTGESPDSPLVSAQIVSLVPPNLSFTISGGELQFTWPADHTGWRLQMNTDLSTTNWQDVPGTEAANAFSIPPTNGAAFFRLVYP
jgi:fibronectin type 3 domain-containing protein